jgi:hypothetical protein
MLATSEGSLSSGTQAGRVFRLRVFTEGARGIAFKKED